MAITVGFFRGLIVRFHSPVASSILPVNTRAPLQCTLHSFISNRTLHPASANFLVDISDKCESPGTMCASINASGSHGDYGFICDVLDWDCKDVVCVVVICDEIVLVSIQRDCW